MYHKPMKLHYPRTDRTTTAGIIKTIEMNFPTGTYVGSSLLVEIVGIGPGTIAAGADETITFIVTNTINVPAHTPTPIVQQQPSVSDPLITSTHQRIVVNLDQPGV